MTNHIRFLQSFCDKMQKNQFNRKQFNRKQMNCHNSLKIANDLSKQKIRADQVKQKIVYHPMFFAKKPELREVSVLEQYSQTDLRRSCYLCDCEWRHHNSSKCVTVNMWSNHRCTTTLATFGLGGCTAIILGILPHNDTSQPICHMWHHPILQNIVGDVYDKIYSHPDKSDVFVYIKKPNSYGNCYDDAKSDFFVTNLKETFNAHVTVELYDSCVSLDKNSYDFKHTLYCGINPEGIWYTNNSGKRVYFV